MPQSLQGATFTISSLGGIGGTGFTPIINPPEVAIFGVARAKWQLRYVNDELKKRLIVPLALSYVTESRWSRGRSVPSRTG